MGDDSQSGLPHLTFEGAVPITLPRAMRRMYGACEWQARALVSDPGLDARW